MDQGYPLGREKRLGQGSPRHENALRGRRFTFWPSADEAAPTVLALHGFTGAVEDFTCLAEQASWWNWLAPVLPGHDVDSGYPDFWDLNLLGGYLQALWAHCKAGQCRVLLGYSMGGRLALHCAVNDARGLSGLVLVGASPGLRTEAERAERRLRDAEQADRLEAMGTAAFLADWTAQPLIATQRQFISSAQLRRMRLARKRHHVEGLCESLRRHGTGALPSLWESLATLQLPVLLVTGGLDEKFTTIAEEMSPLLGRGQHVVLEGVGHAAHLEAPEAFVSVLQRWMDTEGLSEG
ncbi:MAG: alpha/beta fold hydrolase [Opitutales bacterium]